MYAPTRPFLLLLLHDNRFAAVGADGLEGEAKRGWDHGFSDIGAAQRPVLEEELLVDQKESEVKGDYSVGYGVRSQCEGRNIKYVGVAVDYIPTLNII